MVQAPQRTAFSGPALIRLLARLTDVDVPESGQSLSDRLSQWLGWTDAIALSSALNGNPPAVAAGARTFGEAEESECARVRTSLANAIVGDSAFAAAKRRGSASHVLLKAPPMDAPVDYAVFRQRYLSIQQTMETGIGNLRGRLRAMLAARTPAMARLAVVDAVMERALSAARAESAGRRARVARQGTSSVCARRSRQTLADAASLGRRRNGCAGHARRMAGHVPQGYAERVACRTGCSFTTGRRVARRPSHPLTGTLCPDIYNLVVFLVGLAAVCWIGAGYVGSNPLALAVTMLIGVCYVAGALELRRYSQATSTLARAVAGLSGPPPSLGAWLDPLHPSLRNAVRLRVEGERVALPGPALTPYLVGLLVLLGMLGTLLGMVATLRGTGMALESATDLQAIRDSLAAPVKGLGFAFGTSIAGVATSAMLGLLSALCRRERIDGRADARRENRDDLAHLLADPSARGKLQAPAAAGRSDAHPGRSSTDDDGDHRATEPRLERAADRQPGRLPRQGRGRLHAPRFVRGAVVEGERR